MCFLPVAFPLDFRQLLFLRDVACLSGLGCVCLPETSNFSVWLEDLQATLRASSSGSKRKMHFPVAMETWYFTATVNREAKLKLLEVVVIAQSTKHLTCNHETLS